MVNTNRMPNLYPTYLKQLDKIENEFSSKHLDANHDLLKGFAKYSAKIQCQLDDSHQWLMRSLIQAADPDLLKAFPAMNTVQVTPHQDLNEAQIIEKNTIIKSETSSGEYQTVSPITVAPIVLTQFQYDKQSSSIQLAFESTHNEEVEWYKMTEALTLYWNMPALYAERLHQLFYYECEKIEINGEIVNDAISFKAQEKIRENMLPVNKAREKITEYASFPQAFYYLYFKSIQSAKTKTLHCRFYFKRYDRDLATFLEKRHFVLFCSPVKRGKEIPAKIIAATDENVLYRLIPDADVDVSILDVTSVQAWLSDGKLLNATPTHQSNFNDDNDLVWEYHAQEKGIRLLHIKPCYKKKTILLLVHLLCDSEINARVALSLEIKDSTLVKVSRLSNDTPVALAEIKQDAQLTLNEMIKPRLSAIYSTSSSKDDFINLFSFTHPTIANQLNNIMISFQCVEIILQNKQHGLSRALLAKKITLVLKHNESSSILLMHLIYQFLENTVEINQWIVMELKNDREELIQSWQPRLSQ